jgi:HK97 family phage prohead protease
MRACNRTILCKFAPGEAGAFTGYASTFGGSPDAYGDIVAPGAFTASLAAHAAAGTVPAMLWSHDQSQPIGVWTNVTEDAKGLAVSGQLLIDGVPQAAAAYALMKANALGLSIGYKVTAMTEGTPNVLQAVDLYEISLVAIPANSRAQITSVKSSPREFERLLREKVGLSVREAKRLCAGGYAAMVRDEPDDSDELAALAEQIKSTTNLLRN